MDYNLLSYLYQEGIIDNVLLENLRNVIGNHVYYYGNQFKYPAEKIDAKPSNPQFKALLRHAFAFYRYAGKKRVQSDKNVLSNAYFNFNSELGKLGFNVVNPAWSFMANSSTLMGDFAFYRQTLEIRKRTFNSTVLDLTGTGYRTCLEQYKATLEDIIKKDGLKALIVPNDVSFFENVAIEVFRKLGLPTFIFLHGLPARYNLIDENRTDYLIVWGQRIKEHYIKTGFKESKILVAGHPRYTQLPQGEIRNNREDILVLAKIGVGSPHSTGMQLYDRGNQIVYLLMLQHVLQKEGIKKVRLRFHPSANAEWHYRFIDPSFFIPDNAPLNNSLQQASLVIGPSSTILLEALSFGVNYIVFEPLQNGKSLLNETLSPPFDGQTDGIPFADSVESLQEILRGQTVIQPDVFSDYIQSPFDISFLKDLI